jgi:hypothetical protein
MKKVELNIPYALKVKDYHDLYDYAKMFKNLSVLIEMEEIGFDGTDYIGIVYIDKGSEYEALRRELIEDTWQVV